jgi:copper chaperone
MIFSVTNMTCGGCVRSITKAIQTADPKASVSADLETRHVAVETSLRTDEVQAVLVKAGYEARPLGA